MSENILEQQKELTSLIERHSLQNRPRATAIPSLFSISIPAKPSLFTGFTNLPFVLLFKV